MPYKDLLKIMHNTCHISSLLPNILDNFIKEYKFADQWKIARIIPLLKVYNAIDLKYYLPISILTISSNIYEKISQLQITNIIEAQQVYNKYQCDYWKNHSTATIPSKPYDNINQ